MSHSLLEASITLVLLARRARIGKYAADNGATKAATLFLKLLDSKIGESNASIVEPSGKKLYMFSSVACCSLANIKLILPKIIDYVIASAVHNRQILNSLIFNFSRFWRFCLI